MARHQACPQITKPRYWNKFLLRALSDRIDHEPLGQIQPGRDFRNHQHYFKEKPEAGYYGSLQVGADILGGYNASGSINYSSGKIESYLNVGYRQRKSEGKDNTDRINLETKVIPSPT